MEARQCIERRQITEEVTMRGRQLDRRYYKKVTAVGSLDRRPDASDFIVIGDGDQVETFSKRCLNERDGGRRVRRVVGVSYAVDVEIAPEKAGPVIQLKRLRDVHMPPYQSSQLYFSPSAATTLAIPRFLSFCRTAGKSPSQSFLMPRIPRCTHVGFWGPRRADRTTEMSAHCRPAGLREANGGLRHKRPFRLRPLKVVSWSETDADIAIVEWRLR